MEKKKEEKQEEEEVNFLDYSLLKENTKKSYEEESFTKMIDGDENKKKLEPVNIEGTRVEYIEYGDKYHKGYKVTKKITTVTKIIGNKVIEEIFTETSIKEEEDNYRIDESSSEKDDNETKSLQEEEEEAISDSNGDDEENTQII